MMMMQNQQQQFQQAANFQQLMPGMDQNQFQNRGFPIQRVQFKPDQTLHIGNLSDNTFENDVYKLFKGHGIVSCTIMFDKSGKSRGFGYVNFKKREDANDAMEKMNNTILNGRPIILSKKKDKEFDVNANLVVKNLPESMGQQEFMSLFKEFGFIDSCKLEIGPDNKSRQFGYVQFAKAEDAQKAIEKLNG